MLDGRRSRLAAAAAGGVLLTLALPPFGWWPLALAGAGVLAWVVEGEPLGRRVVLGLAAGGGFLVPGLFWMNEFSLPGWLLSSALESALFAGGLALAPSGRARLAALPAAMVLAEAVRGAWPFGGVPIATLAQTQIGGPLLLVARLGGALAVAAVVAVAGVALAQAARRRPLSAAVAAGVVVVAGVAGALAPDGRATGALDAALVQAGGERGTRAVNTSSRVVFDAHLETSEGVTAGLDLVLWPEDVVDVEGSIVDAPHGRLLADLADRLDTTLVVGSVEGAGDRFRNFATAWDPTGEPLARYEKNQRVPFGEHIPFRGLVERVADVSAVPRDAAVGRGPGLLPTPAGRLGVVISYEVFFARRARAAMLAGAEVLLVPTNASSFSTTQMPAIELASARLRAVETGRWVLQAAPTGFSAVVDPAGRVVARSDLGERAVLEATVERRRGDTPYTRTGDGPLVIGATAVLAAGWALARLDAGRREAAVTPPAGG